MPAQISLEVALGLNSVIAVHWIFKIYPTDYDRLPSEKQDFLFVVAHVVPFLTLYVNLLISNLNVLSSDWKLMIPAGIVFFLLNALGKIIGFYTHFE